MSGALASPRRVAALDITKGVLVVCMVIYHTLNYSTQYYLAFRYFAFLPPSFIVITGFLLARIYPAKHSLTDWRLHGRLVTRGVKLIVLFTLLNVAIQFLVRRSVLGETPGLETFFSYWFETYVVGYGRLAAFEVLLPIAYLLLLAPLLLMLDRSHALVLPILTACAIGILAWLALHGGDWSNAQLISAGLIGLLLGRVSFSTLEKLSRYGIALALAYAVYFMVGSIQGQSYLLQLVGAVLALALIYSVSARIDAGSVVGQCLGRLGQYSLIAYIGQIGILQLLVRWLGRPEPGSFGCLAGMLATLSLTVISVELVHRARCRSEAVGGLYKAVFA